MSKHPRYIAPHSLVDLSCRCIQGRFLLRPSKLLNELILGVLVLALRGTGIQVHSFCVMSNHWHILASIPSTQAMALAMKFFQANTSKEAGRLHGWRGTLWSSRYKPVPVDDDEASQIAPALVTTWRKGSKRASFGIRRTGRGSTLPAH